MRVTRGRLALLVLAVAAIVGVVAILGSGSDRRVGTAAGDPAADCHERVPPKADGSSWQCTFDEEFSGEALDRGTWTPQDTATSGYTSGRTACFVDSPANVAVGGGLLRLTARKEHAPLLCRDPHGPFETPYTSGMVSTTHHFSQTYGRFAIRARVPAAAVRGLQTALWLYPDDPARYGGWPAAGEIDIAETYSLHPDRAIPYVHYQPAGEDPNVTNTSCMLDLSQFHTYVAEWTDRSIRITYDGRPCLEDDWHPADPLTKPQPFDQPFFVALTQALGIGTNAFDPETTPLPATTEVDYVRVWK